MRPRHLRVAAAAVAAPVRDGRLVLAAFAVLVAVGAAQAGDLLTFVRMVAVSGIGAELNPLVAYGHEQVGLGFLVAVKAALVVLVAAVFAIVARRHHRTAALVATVGTIAGLFGAYSNLLAVV